MLEVNDNNFDKEVLQWPGSVLVDFWSPTCVYCRQMMPTVQDIAGAKAGLLKVVSVNTAASPYTTMRFQIQGVPYYFIFQNGQMINRLGGALPKPQFEQWIYQAVGV
jgi:thioredoxin-like negative regulator of GroEL